MLINVQSFGRITIRVDGTFKHSFHLTNGIVRKSTGVPKMCRFNSLQKVFDLGTGHFVAKLEFKMQKR